MHTRVLMTASGLLLGLAGLFALFAPHEFLAMLNVEQTDPLPVVIQILGSLYLSFAITNWTAKDSAIGGIYARPTSMGNFTHFTIGALTLANFLLTNGFSMALLIAMVVYTLFALIFAWLAFVATGIPS